MTARAYYSTDGSAPTLANSQNSLASLLYSVLVTGYGAKSGLGWTREFTGTGKAVFKQGSGGIGHVFRIDDDVSGGSYAYANITIGKGATDVDTLIDGPGTILRMYKLPSPAATGLHWVVAGNEKGFWFGTKRLDSTNVWTFFWVGESVSAFPTSKPDKLPFFMGGNTANDYDGPTLFTTTVSTPMTSLAAMGGPDGTLAAANLGAVVDNQFLSTAANQNWPGPNNALQAVGRSVFYGTWANAQAAIRLNGGMLLKGRWPGHVLSPYLDNFEDGFNNPEFTITNGYKTSATYKMFRQKTESAGSDPQHALLLEISDTWDN